MVLHEAPLECAFHALHEHLPPSAEDHAIAQTQDYHIQIAHLLSAQTKGGCKVKSWRHATTGCIRMIRAAGIHRLVQRL
jgi:hypothetical protein